MFYHTKVVIFLNFSTNTLYYFCIRKYLYKNTNDDSDKRISIDFSKGQNVIEKINIDNKLVYVKEDKMDLKTIVIGIIIGVFCFLGIVYVKRKKKMKLD